MERAEEEKKFVIKGFEDVSVARVKWPMSVIRLRTESRERLCELAGEIFKAWRGYTDESVFIFAQTDGEPHNTVTPILRKKNGEYELDIVLRNNITTEEFPMGVYHPHENLHHIKRENIGLIEVMGLAVLPSRLKREIALLVELAEEGRDFETYEETKKHADWAKSVIVKKKKDEPMKEFFLREVGYVFLNCLHDAAVFKRTDEGIAAFDKFMESLCQD